MGASTANISRDMYNEQKEYRERIFQQGPNKPFVDADINAAIKSLYNQLRRNLQLFGSSGSPDNGFKIEESGIDNVNNFKIKGGDGTGDGAGRAFLVGHLALLFSDVEWNTLTADGDYIHDRSTGLTATVLTYSAGNWSVNELAGRSLCPDTTVGSVFTIASNTQTTITITAGDMTAVASVGDSFRIDPSTPGGVRTDIVYLDIYLDEIDETEDTNLEHPLSGGSSFVSAVVKRLKHVVRVRENSTTVPTSPFTDADSNVHYYVKLATLLRDANDTITAGEITDDLARDIISLAALRAEIIAARGSEASLDARLDVSLKETGILNDGIIYDIMVNAAADIAQSKIADSAVEDDSFVGTPTDLEDDLNQIRTKIKNTKGTSGWEDAPTRTLDAVEAEVTTARGSKSSLDDRLDVALNEDGTLDEEAVGVIFNGMGAEQSILFYPKDGSWQTTYRLHSFRGSNRPGDLAGDHGFISYGPYHTSYPLDIVLGGAAGPGGKDNDVGNVVAQEYKYVYLVWKDTIDKDAALVYSQQSRSPQVGPLLTYSGSGYDWITNGYPLKNWKFVGALRNVHAGSWEIVPIRKKGNHVEYEQEQVVYSGTGSHAGNISLATRVPPTSMRPKLNLFGRAVNDASVTAYVSPPRGSGGGMELQDLVPISPLSALWKIWMSVNSNLGASWDSNNNPGDCGTDDLQNIYLNVLPTGGGTKEFALYVRGYEEFTDRRGTGFTW